MARRTVDKFLSKIAHIPRGTVLRGHARIASESCRPAQPLLPPAWHWAHTRRESVRNLEGRSPKGGGMRQACVRDSSCDSPLFRCTRGKALLRGAGQSVGIAPSHLADAPSVHIPDPVQEKGFFQTWLTQYSRQIFKRICFCGGEEAGGKRGGSGSCPTAWMPASGIEWKEGGDRKRFITACSATKDIKVLFDGQSYCPCETDWNGDPSNRFGRPQREGGIFGRTPTWVTLQRLKLGHLVLALGRTRRGRIWLASQRDQLAAAAAAGGRNQRGGAPRSALSGLDLALYPGFSGGPSTQYQRRSRWHQYAGLSPWTSRDRGPSRPSIA